MTDRKFFKNTITILVLTEDEPYDFDRWGTLAYDMTEGSAVGDLRGIESTEVTAEAMADLLYEVGSDPSYFDLDDTEEA